MEKLLKKAFEKADALPEEEKEAFAAFMIEELEHEERWEALYSRSKEQLSTMAEEALKEYKEGNTDDLTPNNL